jgi:pilus assembly protein TadC
MIEKMHADIFRRIFITASKVFPRKYKEGIRESLIYAGIDTEPEIWLGESLILGFFVFLVIAFLSNFGNPLLFYILAIFAYIIYLVGSYSIPYFISMNRADTVENCLPNALQLMASNVRAGMTPFQSMKFSARKEFGLLKDEIDRATTKALGTASFPDALLKITDRIKLPSLERAVRLFSRCIESGGPLAKAMEETARDISETRALKREFMTNTKTYVLLILFVIVIGSPLLLTISIQFTEKLADMRSSFEASEIEGMDMGMLIGGGAFTPEFLVNVSIVSLIITSLIAGILIGVIKEGQEIYGLKYAAFLVPLTLIVFYIMRYVAKLVMG